MGYIGENIQRFFRILLDSLAALYAWLVHPDQKRKIPPIINPILLKPAVELADNIRNGKVNIINLIKRKGFQI